MSESFPIFPWINDPREVLARTVFGEDRGGGYEGMQAVANVVMNRVASGITWWGHDVLSVCLAPEQFSVWNPFTRPVLFPPNADYEAVINTQADSTADGIAFAQAVEIAAKALDGALPDITGGAVNYLSEGDPRPWPSWATPDKETCRIGGQVFFRGA